VAVSKYRERISAHRAIHRSFAYPQWGTGLMFGAL